MLEGDFEVWRARGGGGDGSAGAGEVEGWVFMVVVVVFVRGLNVGVGDGVAEGVFEGGREGWSRGMRRKEMVRMRCPLFGRERGRVVSLGQLSWRPWLFWFFEAVMVSLC